MNIFDEYDFPIKASRMDELLELWGNETNDPETQEYYWDLEVIEKEFIDFLDNKYDTGIERMCKDFFKIKEN